MGRYPDDPMTQAAKGYPGRRRRKVETAVAALTARITAETKDDPLRLPDQFVAAERRWSIAIRIWTKQASILRTSGRAQAAFVQALARYCIWSQVFEQASDELGRETHGKSLTIEWTKGDGATRRLPHPALTIMKDAESILRSLEDEFGFTPLSDADLSRATIFAARAGAGQGELPFGPASPSEPATATTSGKTAAVDPLDLMTATDSVPPGPLN